MPLVRKVDPPAPQPRPSRQTRAERYPPLSPPADTALRAAVQGIARAGTPTPAMIADLRAADIYLDNESQPVVVLMKATESAPAQIWALADDSIQGVAADTAVLRIGRVPRVSRLDIKRSHGWMVRFYRGTDERTRLCSDLRYGSSLGALRAAVTMVAASEWPE